MYVKDTRINHKTTVYMNSKKHVKFWKKKTLKTTSWEVLLLYTTKNKLNFKGFRLICTKLFAYRDIYCLGSLKVAQIF